MWMWTQVALAVTFDDLSARPAEVVLADRATPGGFKIIALSHLAEGCVGRYRDGTWDQPTAAACVDRVAEAALDPRLSPYHRSVATVDTFGENGLFLSHLAIVLGARDELHPEACDAALHERIAAHLERRSLADAHGVQRSYPSAVERWPADQAATLYALWLHQRAHASGHLDAPLAKYLEHTLPADRLPRSELTGAASYAELARGTALTWTVRYLAPIEPERAAALWAQVKAEGFVVSYGPVSGVREYAPGIDRPADIDSGPIVAGIGAAATAFGQAAARAVGDTATADALARTQSLGLVMTRGDDALAAAANSALAVAIADAVAHPR
ncbi:MAG: hypothetical protein ABMA64_32765 [Myxococcota bacterium]